MSETRVCAREGCDNKFVPSPGPEEHIYCDTPCRVAQWKADTGYVKPARENAGNATLPGRKKNEPGWKFVLRCLRHRGPVGVTTSELRAAFQGNPSQRVNEVRGKGGHQVDAIPEPTASNPNQKRYVLVRDADTGLDGPSVSAVGGEGAARSGGASTTPAAKRPSEIEQWEADAA